MPSLPVLIITFAAVVASSLVNGINETIMNSIVGSLVLFVDDSRVVKVLFSKQCRNTLYDLYFRSL